MQLTLELQPGLTQQYRSLRECLCAVVYQHRAGTGTSGAAVGGVRHPKRRAGGRLPSITPPTVGACDGASPAGKPRAGGAA